MVLCIASLPHSPYCSNLKERTVTVLPYGLLSRSTLTAENRSESIWKGLGHWSPEEVCQVYSFSGTKKALQAVAYKAFLKMALKQVWRSGDLLRIYMNILVQKLRGPVQVCWLSALFCWKLKHIIFFIISFFSVQHADITLCKSRNGSDPDSTLILL